MEAKHTPGPYVARKGTVTGAEVMARKPKGGEYVIARCPGKDREANAALFAASEELLSAGVALLEVLEVIANREGGDFGPEIGPVAYGMMNAIARARGEG